MCINEICDVHDWSYNKMYVFMCVRNNKFGRIVFRYRYIITTVLSTQNIHLPSDTHVR